MFMLNLKYKAYIYAAYVYALAMLVVLGYMSYNASKEIEQNIIAVLQAHEVLSESEQLSSMVKDAQRAQRGYLLTEDTVYLAQFETSGQQALHSLASLKNLTAQQARQQHRLIELSALVNETFQYWHKTLALSLGKQHTTALNLVKEGTGYTLASKIEKLALDFQLYEKAMLQKQLYEYQSSRKEKKYIELGLGAFSILILALTFLGASQSFAQGASFFGLP